MLEEKAEEEGKYPLETKCASAKKQLPFWDMRRSDHGNTQSRRAYRCALAEKMKRGLSAVAASTAFLREVHQSEARRSQSASDRIPSSRLQSPRVSDWPLHAQSGPKNASTRISPAHCMPQRVDSRSSDLVPLPQAQVCAQLSPCPPMQDSCCRDSGHFSIETV